jgi:predicted dehydrogenase
MDYIQAPLKFKLKKAARYVRLYGPARTLIKIQGQMHMKKRYEKLPQIRSKGYTGRHVGFIGCGNYAFSNLAYYLKRNFGNVIRASADTDIYKAASLFERYHLDYFTNNPNEVVEDQEIDLIYIASNHASHAEYAVKALELGKSVHIEKPHAVTEDQLRRLCGAAEKSSGKINLGFNRPGSKIGAKIKEALDSQTGATMMNWFVAGHEIEPSHWYFRQEEGGRVLGNLCHWTDFILQMIPETGRYPTTIIPTRAEKSDCDIAVTYIFGDGSIAAITFSAKGHTFEGVRERFAAHRGNILISMDDFQNLVIEEVDKKSRVSCLFRDHGHERNIVYSYRMATKKDNEEMGLSVKYIWETGELFLKTREALETNQRVSLVQYSAGTLS